MGVEMGRGGGAAVAAAAAAGEDRREWEEAMRSEWSSPSDKINGIAVLTPPVVAGKCTAATGRAVVMARMAAAGAGPVGGGERLWMRPGGSVEVGQILEATTGESSEAIEVGTSGCCGGWSGGGGGGGRDSGGVGGVGAGSGGGGRKALRKCQRATRWGRMDLLSVLYPPPPLPSTDRGELERTHGTIEVSIPQVCPIICFSGFTQPPLS